MTSSKNQITHPNQEVAFELKEGRRLTVSGDVAYILPSDQGEVDRLEENHKLWKHLLEGLFKSPLHEKLTKGIRVLDIGCGPGWWTLDMARSYPNSDFTGVDMADVFVTADAPPNAKFKILNAGTELDSLESESFDFVFQRFLVMGFPTDQYKRSVEEVKRILKPGGSIEILEMVNEYKNAGPAFKIIDTWIDNALTARNMDSFIADKIPSFLKDVGFQDIEHMDYNVPMGAWGGEAGRSFLAIQQSALSAVKVMVTELTTVTSEIYTANMEKAFEEVDQYKISTRFKLICATK